MARTMRYRRKRGVYRRRAVTKTSRRRLQSSAGPLYPRRGPINMTTGRIRLKRRAGQLVPGNLRRVRRRFVPKGETEKEKAGGFFTGQLDKYTFKLGRKKRISQHLSKLDRKSALFSIERFGATNRFTSDRGAYNCFMTKAGALTNYPLWLLELDATSFQTGISSPTDAIMWQCFDNGSNAIGFWPVQGRMNDGALSAYPMQGIKWNGRDWAMQRNNYICEWSNIKLLFKCPQGRPGFVKAWLVQFPEVNCEPQVTPNTDRTALFQKIVKEHIYSPISHELTGLGRKYHNGMKVLKTWTKNFNPDSKENYADYSGQQIRMDLFLRHNRYVNRYPRVGQPTTAALLDDDAYKAEVEADVPCSDRPADPRARIYLMITSTNFDPATDSEQFDKLKHVTFDLEFRGKRVWGPASVV